jgi:hypothetical protein
MTKDNSEGGELLLGRNQSGPAWSAAICNMGRTYVEAQVRCIGQDCAVSKIRRSLSAPAIAAWTWFDCPNRGSYQLSGAPDFQKFATMFTSSLAPARGAFVTPVSGYMANPIDPMAGGKYPQASTLAPREYSKRVGQLLNTYWGIMGGTVEIITGIKKTNESSGATCWL